MRTLRAFRGTGTSRALGISISYLAIPGSLPSIKELELEADSLAPKGGWRFLGESLYLLPTRATYASGSLPPREGLLMGH